MVDRMIYLTCGRCGSYLGSAKDPWEAKTINTEHIAECEVVN